MAIDFEALERGGCGEGVRTMTPEVLGKIFFCCWVFYGSHKREHIVHRDTILALREQCVDSTMPPILCSALQHEYAQELMLSGIVCGGLARHLDGAVRGELCIVLDGLQALFLLQLFALDFPDEVAWIRERISRLFPVSLK
jgi:hypothetical protein